MLFEDGHHVRLRCERISHAVDDIARKGTNKEVRWFMGKYDIDYDEYSYLSWAAIPATNYYTDTVRMRKYVVMCTNRLKEALTEATKELKDLKGALPGLTSALTAMGAWIRNLDGINDPAVYGADGDEENETEEEE